MSKTKAVIMYIVSKLYNLLIRARFILKLPFHKALYSSETYYPEFSESRKSSIRIMGEQLLNIIQYGAPNHFYFLYGFDIKGLRNKTEYIDNHVFIKRRNAMDKKYKEFPPISILREKDLFGIAAEAYGIYSPHNIATISNGIVFLFNEKKSRALSNDIFIKCLKEGNGDVFVKKMDGECADGIYHIVLNGDEFLYNGKSIDISTFFNQGFFLIQEAIRNQHSAVALLNDKAINTLRLVTVFNDKSKEIEVFSCVLRVGCGANSVDNWAAGGLSIGVDTENGTLRKYGFFKPGFGTKTIEHPDSHVVFDGYKIPFIEEAIIQAKAFHSQLHGIHSIGWDVAITDDGPCFIEGNDNWEISLMQISNHGLKKEFDKLFY